MIIDVSSILKEFGGKVSFDDKAEIPDLNFGGGDYRFKEPLSVKGGVSNTGGALTLKADVSGVMVTQCARCMKDINVPIEFTISETLMRSDDSEMKGTISDDEDVIVFEGNTISLDEIIENNFIMNLSPRYLCSEDCKGLCPKCGKDLNEGNCDCDDDEIDPRWAALADMIKKD